MLKYKEKGVEIDKIIKDLEQLRRFLGNPAEFWTRFIEESTGLVEADLGLLLVKDEASETSETSDS